MGEKYYSVMVGGGNMSLATDIHPCSSFFTSLCLTPHFFTLFLSHTLTSPRVTFLHFSFDRSSPLPSNHVPSSFPHSPFITFCSPFYTLLFSLHNSFNSFSPLFVSIKSSIHIPMFFPTITFTSPFTFPNPPPN